MSINEDIGSVNLIFFQRGKRLKEFTIDNLNLPIGTYQLDKKYVKSLDLEQNHVVMMENRGKQEEYLVSETLTDGGLLLNPKNDIKNFIVGARHAVYLNEEMITRNTSISLIKKEKGKYPQIFENIYVLYSLTTDDKSGMH